MAFSYNEVGPVDPGFHTVSLTFPFLDRIHVSVSVDKVVLPESAWVWNSDTQIELNEDLVGGEVVKAFRTTPAAGVQADFKPGAFDYEELNTSLVHLLYIVQEAYDNSSVAVEAGNNAFAYLLQIEGLVQEAEGLFEDMQGLYAGYGTQATAALSALSLARSNALNDIASALAAALVTITSNKDAAVGFITTALSTALGEITTAKNAAIATLTPLVNQAQGFRNEAETFKTAAGVHAANAFTYSGLRGLFKKAAARSVVWQIGGGGVQLKSETIIEVAGGVQHFTAVTQVALPTLVVGTDYAIWIKPDGSLVATADHISPPVADSRKLGGFHYAPGGNATAMAGGNTTPTINPYSFWDLKFRPSCPDPRGMVLIAGKFWCDIYLLGVNHHTDGTSKYNVTIADGASPPKVPTAFGGNDSTAYASLNWWEAAEVLQSHGKELLDVAEFGAAMYGTTENTSGVTDPGSTILRAAFTSKWGVMLATGNLWVWGRDFGGSFGTAAYTANGRGSTYMLSNASLFGGYWDYGAGSGSRSSSWGFLPSSSYSLIGARGRSDHLYHE